MINSEPGLPMPIRRLSLLLLLAACAVSCGKGREPAAGSKAGTALPPRSEPPVEVSDIADRARRPAGGAAPVIWLGLDGLDWELLDRLSAEGKMPNWSRLTREGSSATLMSFMPVLSPVVWTTAATGVGPDIHRVLDFQEVDPKTGRKVPISGLSRAVPALWNLASAAGKKVGVVGWWATHPAEEVRGFFVSDNASSILFSDLPRAGAVYPPALAAGVEQVISRDGRVQDEELPAFLDVPGEEIARARQSGAGMENPTVALARILGSTRVVHRIARDLYDRNHPDLMAVYLQGTDEIAHVFASYAPPKMDCVSPDDFSRYARAVDVYYALIDRMLGQWMRRSAEDGATLLVHSDHGFKWGARRTCERSSQQWNTAAYWHRLEGVLAVWGARVRPSAERGRASVFDVAPTIASLLGVPADRRMTGRPLTRFFRDLAPPPRRDAFGSVTVRRVSAAAMSEKEAGEYAKKLLALGYLSGSDTRALEPTGGDRPAMTEGAWNNLGLYLRETVRDLEAARAAFEKSLSLRSDYASPMFNLAILHRARRDDEKAQEWLFRSLAAGHADPEGTLLRWSAEYGKNGRRAQARTLLERAVREHPDFEQVALELALMRFQSSRDCPGAYAVLSRFEAATENPAILNALGLFHTCLGRRDQAVALFERSLAVKADQPAVVQSLDLVRRGAPSAATRP